MVVQPPVTVAMNSELRFSQSFCSFDFASTYRQLLDHTSHQPLTVEVWQSRDQSHDQIVGISQVPLVIVLSQEKAVLENGTSTRQVFNMQAHVTPPTSPTPYPVNVSLGKLNVVLILEDLGAISLTDGLSIGKDGRRSAAEQALGVNGISHQFTPLKPCNANTDAAAAVGRVTSVQDHVTSLQGHMTTMKDHMTSMQRQVTNPTGKSAMEAGRAGDPESRAAGTSGRKKLEKDITESSEYKVAMELEMWKLAEEEAFKVSMLTPFTPQRATDLP